ncbi:MAG: cation acetate symporter [Opitutales bacterium]|jgi:Na+(H+)/acetate symporter ActP
MTALLAMTVDPWIAALALLTVAVTVAMGFWSAGKSKSAGDFFVAGRSVSVGWNASAISGEYLSAASFMGVAGMVMLNGYDALWYPVCYACGYLFLLLFIAGPLRRFGAYTIPDFAEGRYDSPLFRKIAVCFVLFIGFFYTMPQMKGAGTTLAYIFPGLPYWAGVVVVGAVITLNVSLGGMKGITLVQAFQYWLKMFAIALPVFVLASVVGHYHEHLGANAAAGSPAVPAAAERKALPAKAPKDEQWIAPFGSLTTKAVDSAIKSAPSPEAKAELEAARRPYSLLYTYSLIIALVCGTAGLPHILVRFYTNPDGVAAKRTTMWVMILIGVFYVFPPVYGVLGRSLTPELYEAVGSKGTDKVVLELPTLLAGKDHPLLGSVLSGITCAGAFAAFMSTFSGLLVSMTGALAHDIYGRILRPQSTPEQRLKAFKWSAVLIGGLAIALGTQVEKPNINFLVGQAFAIAAASYFPLLFMSVWWRGMTMKGAASGMLGGGLAALAAITLTTLSDVYSVQSLADFWVAHPLLRILCEQPAIWAVPLSIGLMIVVSKATAAEVPADVRMKMLVLHAPESLGLKQEYIKEHEGLGH